MHSHRVVVALAIVYTPLAIAISGKTWTSWDCCKPSCAWSQNVPSGVQGIAKVCDVNNNPLSNTGNLKSGCVDGDGGGFLCDSYSPIPTSNDLSYGFAVSPSDGNCCKCYQLTWTSGNAAGKSMIVQAINTFKPSGNQGSNDLVIIVPGGGVGPNTEGCQYQYGSSMGNANGGVNSGGECANLNDNLQGGCYWRFNWARGNLNGWNINYNQVSCPSRLTAISGCSA